MKLKALYGGFDFDNVWFIDRNLEYQYPQLIHNRQIPKAETPTAVEITAKPEKLSYFTGEAFDSTGLVVSVVYENGDKEEVTRYTLSGYDSSTAGTKTITVTYGDLTATFDVEVEEKPPVLTSIAIIKQPDKMNYYVGDAFDGTGLAVYAVYDNGSSKEITDYTLSGYDSSTTGKKTITVSYEGFTAAFDVEVQEKPVKLTSISVVKKPDKLSYFVGEAFDDTGMVVVALYDNNTTEAVTDYTLSGFDSSTTGKKTITVAYKGLTATFDVEVKEKPVSLTSITIVHKPDKLSYFIGEEFDSTGLIVNAVYDNGTSKAVTDYTLSGFDNSTVGKKTITVAYKGLKATFDVEVKEKPVNLTSIMIVHKPNKLNYFTGEEFDSKGMIVNAVYDNGTSKAITDYTLSGFDSSTAGKKTITVSYEDFTAAFDVEVQEKPVNLTSVAIVKKPDKLSYFVGEAFDDTGMVVVALYDNNTTEAVNDYNFSGFDSSTTGKKTITVAYKGLTATFDVEIKEKPVNLTSITIVQKPDKLSYFIDEEFDSTGLIVNAVYDNGTSKAVTDYTLSGFDSSTVGKKTITVTYGDYTAGFEVEVKAQPVYLKSLTVIKQPDKTVYNIGEELDTKGMMVIGVYSDGAVVNISDYTVSKLTEDIGEQTVTVSYEGKTATFNVTVEDKKVLIGDVNNDGQVNGADAGVLSRYAAGWKGYADKIKNLKAADVNNDGSVNGADAGILARYTSGWKQYAKFFES
ncbi:MAG: bacterial Ig-like domain-containing protein [Ruminococcus sp.]|nr:bacterial Ig-like domain-containing protein [Ruminococcus sp.]